MLFLWVLLGGLATSLYEMKIGQSGQMQQYTVHESKPIQECLPKIITEKFDF